MDNHKITLFDVKTDDVVDYKKTALLLAFPNCYNKYCSDCQNAHLRNELPKRFNINDIVDLYNRLDEHKAIVCAGLDPMDSLTDLQNLILAFNDNDKSVDIVIYTGYTDSEIESYVKNDFLRYITNDKVKLIVKFGRYDKNNKNKYMSNILGVELAGDNQIVKEYTIRDKEYLL